jgi:phospholipid-transporting ATPase
MSDDFLRLVSQSNPATRQYQPANNGYPPSSTAGPYTDSSPQQLMDPFFDDEDENVPDSAFGRPIAMRSQESGLPLARSAAPPAGVTGSSATLPQDWIDDDEFQPSDRQNFPGPPKSSLNQGSGTISRFKSRKWKWPWRKETVLTGERVIALNNSVANSEFVSNFVSTSKYNLITFVPKFLYGPSSSVLTRISL